MARALALAGMLAACVVSVRRYALGWGLVGLVVVLGVGGLAPVRAAAADFGSSPVFSEFTGGVTAAFSTGRAPAGVTAGPDGNLWFAECHCPTGPGGPPEGIGRVTPGGAFTEFTTGLTGGPSHLVAGPPGDGNVWFTEFFNNKVAKITPGGVVTEFSGLAGSSGPGSSGPAGIAVGPDGALWFAQYQGVGYIGKVTTAGSVSEVATGGVTPGFPSTTRPLEIVAGPDGNLWFTQRTDPGRISRITPAGAVTEVAKGGVTPGFSANGSPSDIVAGPDGNLWFTESAGPGRIAKITPTGTVTEVATGGVTPGFTAGLQPTLMTFGPDGNMWVASAANPGAVQRVTPQGTVTEFQAGQTPGFTANTSPNDIAAGPDGNLWFTGFNDPGTLTRISPTATGGGGGPAGPAPAAKRGSAVQVRCDFIFSIAANVCTAVVVDQGPSPAVTPTGQVKFVSARGGGAFTRGDTCVLSTSLAPANGQPGAVASPGAALCTVIFKPPSNGPTAAISAGYLGDAQHDPSGAGVRGGPLSPAQSSAQSCLAASQAQLDSQQITQHESLPQLAAQGALNVSFPAQVPGRLDATLASGPSLSGGLAVRVSPPIGHTQMTLSNPGSARVRIALSAAGRGDLRRIARRHRGVQLNLRLVFTPADGGAPITTTRPIRVLARRPPKTLVLGQAHTTPTSTATRVRVTLTAATRQRLRRAARAHRAASFLLYARAINDGGQTVTATATITLPARPGRHGQVHAAATHARIRVGCNPIPTASLNPAGLSQQGQALGQALDRAAQNLAKQTPNQLAHNGGYTLASGPSLGGGLAVEKAPEPVGPIAVGPSLGGGLGVEKPPTLDTGILAVGPSLGSGLAVFNPPPPPILNTLAVGPLLGCGLGV